MLGTCSHCKLPKILWVVNNNVTEVAGVIMMMMLQGARGPKRSCGRGPGGKKGPVVLPFLTYKAPDPGRGAGPHLGVGHRAAVGLSLERSRRGLRGGGRPGSPR